MKTWVFVLGGGAVATALLLQRRRHARELAEARFRATSRDVVATAAAMVEIARNRAQAESITAMAAAATKAAALEAAHGRRADGKPDDTLSL